MARKIDMHKAAANIIRDKRFLVERSRGKPVWGHPGGKIEPGETPKQALVRELEEEFTIQVSEDDLDFFGTFYGEAARDKGKWLQMDVFTVRKFSGTITPSSEVDDVAFINSDTPKDMEISSICRNEVIPMLKEQGLVD